MFSILIYLVLSVQAYSQSLENFLPEKELTVKEKVIEEKIKKSKNKVFYKKMEKKTQPKVEIVFDGSGSMGQILSSRKSKMYHSKELLKRYLEKQWQEKALVGLRVYGAKVKGSCKDSELLIDFQEKSLYDIESKIKRIGPLGMTPLHSSIMKAVKDLEDYDGPKRIIILTDGEDTCGGDPCKTAEYLKSKEDVNLKFYTVGVGFEGGEFNLNNLKCLGPVLNADNEEDLKEGLDRIDNDIFSDFKNLRVITPKKTDTVRVYRLDENGKRGKLARKFTSGEKIKLKPGEYQAVVSLNPKFIFKKFKIKENKLTILHVKGSGSFIAKYFDNLINVEVYDIHGKVIKTARTGEKIDLPMGRYEIRLYNNPFYEFKIPYFQLDPNSSHSYHVRDATSYVFKNKKLAGFHVYKGDNLFGKFLTNAKGVIPNGKYKFHLNKSCTVEDIKFETDDEFKQIVCAK